jgi:hypothetical protein
MPKPRPVLFSLIPGCRGASREQSREHRVPVPSGRGRLRRSGPPRPGTDRPAGHGKADQGLSQCPLLCQGSGARRGDLRRMAEPAGELGRCLPDGDRCFPLRSGRLWPRCGPSSPELGKALSGRGQSPVPTPNGQLRPIFYEPWLTLGGRSRPCSTVAARTQRRPRVRGATGHRSQRATPLIVVDPASDLAAHARVRARRNGLAASRAVPGEGYLGGMHALSGGAGAGLHR